LDAVAADIAVGGAAETAQVERVTAPDEPMEA